MRTYGEILSETWPRDKFQQASDRCRLFILYCLTGPHSNISGAFRAPIPYISTDLAWDDAATRKVIAEAADLEIAWHCDRTGWTFCRWNLKDYPPKNGSACARLEKEVDQVPDVAEFWSHFLAELKAFAASPRSRSAAGTDKMSPEFRSFVEGAEAGDGAPARTQRQPKPRKATKDEAQTAWTKCYQRAEASKYTQQGLNDRTKAALNAIGGLSAIGDASGQRAISAIESRFIAAYR